MALSWRQLDPRSVRVDPATCDHETVILVPSDEGFPEEGWLCAACSTPFAPLHNDGRDDA